MNIELRRFFESDGARQDFEYEFTSVDGIFSPISVKGFIKNSAGIVSLSAEARFTVSAQCAKCAKSISKEMCVPVRHFLINHLNNEDNDEYILVEDMVLKLDELVMEDIYLSLPSRFLCKDDCKGLCPICGKDLNEGECGCKREIDPRLAVLQRFFDNDDE